jgi:hypothetical protein
MICEIYLDDDIIIYGKGEAEFLDRMERVFEHLSLKKEYLKPKV